MSIALQEMLAALPNNNLIELHNSIVEAEIRSLNGKDTKKVFSGMAKKSTGKLKKIYTALRKANKNDLNRAFDLRAEIL